MAKNYDTDQNSHNIIANGTTIKGDIITNSDIRIDGNVEGTLKSTGHVIIGDAGHFSGTLTSKDVDVWGKMDGTLTATETLNLRHSGKIKGDIIVGTLIIEQGAEFNGTCKMGAEIPKENKQTVPADNKDGNKNIKK